MDYLNDKNTMNSLHTPTPWALDKSKGHGAIISVPTDFIICDVYPKIDQSYEANVRLILAAPDLLKAATKMLNKLNDVDSMPFYLVDEAQGLKDAIKKATDDE